MIFWLILAAMTLAALASVALPFILQAKAQRSGNDVAVYKDQLQEIERDRANGQIGDEEAEAARIEVSRRLLKAAHSEDASKAEATPETGARRRRVAALAFSLVAATALSGGLYYRLGNPGEAEPKQIVRGKGPGGMTLDQMIAAVEDHIQKNPNDGRSYEVLAPVYMRVGRFDDAANAWRQAIALLGDTSIREAGLGEALVGASDGIVTDAAKGAFDKALALDKESVPARYYKALGAMQDGRRDDARRMWSDMLASAPPDAPWAPTIKRALAELDRKPGEEGGPAPKARPSAPGPSSSDVAAAEQMTKQQRMEMINSMVARLADKLKRNGDDPDGWVRLVRAYGVLGDAAKQTAAIADARKALAGDADKLRTFEEGVKGAPPQR